MNLGNWILEPITFTNRLLERTKLLVKMQTSTLGRMTHGAIHSCCLISEYEGPFRVWNLKSREMSLPKVTQLAARELG